MKIVCVVFFVLIGIQRLRSEKYPYAVRIFITKLDPKRLDSCSGALFLKNWVVTSANCVDDVLPGQVLVYSGDFRTKLVRSIQEIHAHNLFNATLHLYDIALLKLKHPFFHATPITTAMFVKHSLLKMNYFDFQPKYRETNATFLTWSGQLPSSRQLKPQRHRFDEEETAVLEGHFIVTEPQTEEIFLDKGDTGGPLLVVAQYLDKEQHIFFGVLSYFIHTIGYNSVSKVMKEKTVYVFTYVYRHFDWIRFTVRNFTEEEEVEMTFQGVPVVPYSPKVEPRMERVEMEVVPRYGVRNRSPYGDDGDEYGIDADEIYEALDRL